MAQDNPQFWLDWLNERAAELGLEKNVKLIKPREEYVGVVTWAFETVAGELVELGWDVEQAEKALREMAGQ